MKQSMKMANAFCEWVPTPGALLQMVTVDNTAAGKVLAALNAKTKFVWLSVIAQPIRVTFDGTAPVGGSVGQYLAAGLYELSAEAAAAMKMIRDTGSSATVAASEFTI